MKDTRAGRGCWLGTDCGEGCLSVICKDAFSKGPMRNTCHKNRCPWSLEYQALREKNSYWGGGCWYTTASTDEG